MVMWGLAEELYNDQGHHRWNTKMHYKIIQIVQKLGEVSGSFRALEPGLLIGNQT